VHWLYQLSDTEPAACGGPPAAGTADERIIRGKRGWWFLGPGGIARLRRGHLTADGRLRPEAERHLRAHGLFTAAPRRSYSLTVLTSTSCNLGCGYCFQNTGQDRRGANRPPRIARARLHSAAIPDILSFAGRQMAEAGLDRLAVLLSGGEPLLTLHSCRELLIRAAEHGLAWAGLASNGTLLTPLVARDLSTLGLRSVQVTFDGDRADHDRIRATRSGQATFDVITNNIVRTFGLAPIRWNLRINISHRNQHGIDTLIDRLADRLDPSACTMTFALVGDIGIGYRNDLTHTSDLATAFARWQRQALDVGFELPLPRAHTPCQTCSYQGGRYGAVISADGTLSSCWETAGKPGWAVGTVAAGYLPDAELEGRWIPCAASRQYARDHTAYRNFQDQVDAALLDYLDLTDRL
jgi:uncharacterized protein